MRASCRPAAQTPWTGYIGKAHPTLLRSYSKVAPLTAVAKSCFGMRKLCNICSSSIYGLWVWFASVRGVMPHAPPKRVQKLTIFGYFFANERPLMSSRRHRRQRNCVNCKCCVVDVPGVSHSCIEYESQLQTSCPDTLNRVYRKGTSNPVTQLFWDGTFDCSGEAMPWYAQTMQYL